jgi:glycosyltransferase involved in cell wall biosynthesis
VRRKSLRAAETAAAAAAVKICHVVASLEERHGGPSRSARALAAAQAALGENVDLWATSSDGGGARLEGALSLRTFRRTRPRALSASAALRRDLATQPWDLVHHHGMWLSTLAYAQRAAQRRRVPLVISPRGMMSDWAWRHRRWKKRLAQWVVHPGAFRAAAGWHATSKEEADDIRARGYGQPVCVAANGIDVPSERSRADAAHFWLELCPEAATRPVALFYSRFHRKKRILELIDLWLEQGPRDWLLLVVGIPQEYSAPSLEDYVLRNLGAGRVRAFSGLGRPAPYAVASLFLLPSHNENFGLVVGEALAAGVPALVTDTMPWRELGPERAGWCVPWAEYGAALRSAMAEGLGALRERGRRGREWMARDFSWEKPARQLVEFYGELAAREAD